MNISDKHAKAVKKSIDKLVGIGMSPSDATRYLNEAANRGNMGKKILGTAAAIPLGAAFINMSGSTIQKATEMGKYMGLRNPLDQPIIDRALRKVKARNPEIRGMDQGKINERALMLYSNSPIMFEPENTEVLENMLMSMRSYNGGDYKLLKEISNVDKEVRSQRNMGATAKDLANLGSLMIREYIKNKETLMSQAYLRDLNQLASNVVAITKEAAYNIGATQVLPTSNYSNFSGGYDPDDGRAYSSRLAQKRVGYAAAQVDQGNTKILDLHPYKGVLNQGYNVLRTNLAKSASADEYYEFEDGYELDEDDEEALLQAYVEELEDSGYFDDVDAVPDMETLELMQEYALEKAASVTDEQIDDMITYGVLENVGAEEYIGELIGSDEEFDYYLDELDDEFEDEFEGEYYDELEGY